jgi:hypothetical protein
MSKATPAETRRLNKEIRKQAIEARIATRAASYETMPEDERTALVRKQTVDEVAEMIRYGSFGLESFGFDNLGLDNKEVQSALRDLAAAIRAAMQTREENLRTWEQCNPLPLEFHPSFSKRIR